MHRFYLIYFALLAFGLGRSPFLKEENRLSAFSVPSAQVRDGVCVLIGMLLMKMYDWGFFNPPKTIQTPFYLLKRYIDAPLENFEDYC